MQSRSLLTQIAAPPLLVTPRLVIEARRGVAGVLDDAGRRPHREMAGSNAAGLLHEIAEIGQRATVADAARGDPLGGVAWGDGAPLQYGLRMERRGEKDA